jgi:sugar/nucleoside kinase (ribokinase family)
MPSPVRGRVPRPGRARPRPPRVTVVGDLTLDVVVAPARPLEHGTDVPGRVLLRQGGSAANAARWLARLGVRTTLVCAVGRDPVGRALVSAVELDGVAVRAARIAGHLSGRIGVVLGAGGERSFVADRGAADQLRPGDLHDAWFRSDAVHLPAYSLIGEPLGLAGRRAIELARAAGAVVSLDLASAAPLLAGGRRAARRLVADAAPDVLFATFAEAEAYLGGHDLARLLDAAPLVVVKRGSAGATILARSSAGSALRFDVATPPLAPTDTTGAGDAFDAGFLASFLGAPSDTRMRPAALRRSAVDAHRAAARQLGAPIPELSLG